MALNKLKKAMVCDRCGFTLRRFHLAQKSTAIVNLSDLSVMPSPSMLAAHHWIPPTHDWFQSLLVHFYRNEHPRPSIFDGVRGRRILRVNVAPLEQYIMPTEAQRRRGSDFLLPGALIVDCLSDLERKTQRKWKIRLPTWLTRLRKLGCCMRINSKPRCADFG